jgi:hypothetical protein
VGSFLFEELNDRLLFLLVGGAGAGRKGQCGSEVDVQLVVEEIHDLLVDVDEAFTPIEGRDAVGGVGRGGRGHCCLWCVAKVNC